MLAVERPELKKKVVKGPEIQEVLHELPMIKTFLMSLYDCEYATFFKSLAEVETYLKSHRIFAVHTGFYVREMRILAYKQLLQSYRSVTLASMAQSFGVSVSFIDNELSRFVAAGRLNCKIDTVCCGCRGSLGFALHQCLLPLTALLAVLLPAPTGCRGCRDQPAGREEPAIPRDDQERRHPVEPLAEAGPGDQHLATGPTADRGSGCCHAALAASGKL